MRLISSEKKQQLIDEAIEKQISSDPDIDKESLKKLSTVLMEHHELYSEYVQEMLALNRKYSEKITVCLKKRNEIINSQNCRIKNFWLTALLNHRTIRASIEEWDKPILQYLTNIEFRYLNPDEMKSFALIFHFSTNPYFSNETLEKQFVHQYDNNLADWLLTQSIGCDIKWYNGKDATVTYKVKKQQPKGLRYAKQLTVRREQSSFFNFFRTRYLPSKDHIICLTEEEISRLENYCCLEYEISQIIKDRIIPMAIGWYLNIEVDSEEDCE